MSRLQYEYLSELIIRNIWYMGDTYQLAHIENTMLLTHSSSSSWNYKLLQLFVPHHAGCELSHQERVLYVPGRVCCEEVVSKHMSYQFTYCFPLWHITHWGQVTHICVSKLTIIGSDNGLSPGRRQAIIWSSARILLIEPLGTNFSEISIAIQTFSFKKMHLNMSSAKWRPFCFGLHVLMDEFRCLHMK